MATHIFRTLLRALTGKTERDKKVSDGKFLKETGFGKTERKRHEKEFSRKCRSATTKGAGYTGRTKSIPGTKKLNEQRKEARRKWK